MRRVAEGRFFRSVVCGDGPLGSAAFCVGDMTAAGVGTGVADAVVCIETIMFAGAHLDALRECRRILAPGGRLVLTGWEATNLADERLPQWARRMDLMRDLTEAGSSGSTSPASPRGARPSVTYTNCPFRPTRPAIQRSRPFRNKPAGAWNCLTARAGFARAPLRRANPRPVR